MSDRCLHLDITEISCRCGNKWTHSHLLLCTPQVAFGGTPSPIEEEKLICKSYETFHRATSHCFRCVKLQLGENWTRPAYERPKPAQPDFSDILE